MTLHEDELIYACTWKEQLENLLFNEQSWVWLWVRFANSLLNKMVKYWQENLSDFIKRHIYTTLIDVLHKQIVEYHLFFFFFLYVILQANASDLRSGTLYQNSESQGQICKVILSANYSQIFGCMLSLSFWTPYTLICF